MLGYCIYRVIKKEKIKKELSLIIVATLIINIISLVVLVFGYRSVVVDIQSNVLGDLNDVIYTLNISSGLSMYVIGFSTLVNLVSIVLFSFKNSGR